MGDFGLIRFKGNGASPKNRQNPTHLAGSELSRTLLGGCASKADLVEDTLADISRNVAPLKSKERGVWLRIIRNFKRNLLAFRQPEHQDEYTLETSCRRCMTGSVQRRTKC